MFILSKLVGLLLQPMTVLTVALAVAALLLFSRAWRLGRFLLVCLVFVTILAGVAPLDQWMIRPLEDRFPAIDHPERVDGIVVLGGAFDPVLSASRRQPSGGGAIERVTTLIELGRRYPDARLVFSGGSGSVTDPDVKEAGIVQWFLDTMGFPARRVLFDAEARNTRENARLARELAGPAEGEVWLLVTSAMHMPRSMGVFRAAGWAPVAWPVDYMTPATPREHSWWDFNPARGFGVLSAAGHEWVGLASYWVLGWSDTLFPAPR